MNTLASLTVTSTYKLSKVGRRINKDQWQEREFFSAAWIFFGAELVTDALYRWTSRRGSSTTVGGNLPG
jgi:hypothetical protein